MVLDSRIDEGCGYAIEHDPRTLYTNGIPDGIDTSLISSSPMSSRESKESERGEWGSVKPIG